MNNKDFLETEIISQEKRSWLCVTKRRVVVTGIGAVTPLGNDAETTWQNIVAGGTRGGAMARNKTGELSAKNVEQIKEFYTEKFLG